ncbi:putative uv radiation resistance protein [Phaeomoniella chlamydospora]|uniref:Autophagy-related protein 14 n=1 Tax=Phaeomoniella chlamydospora TaxID=158046 RepID=A0A0G2EDZ1_PHACM|nr:putative uv radiation resistance protein [Phaeomoniella chlamydospora]
MDASPDQDVFSQDSSGRRERPFLLPWNRRVRHLHGISIRNLDVTTQERFKGRTITDDENVPSALRSPLKLLARNEVQTLQHSQSFSSLKSHGKDRFSHPDKASTSYGELMSSGDRPRIGKMRRRSTLYCPDPIYVSEEIEDAMNPTFRAFDLNGLGPELSRSDKVTVKLWAKSSGSERYLLVLTLDLSLRSLQYIGKTLDNFHHPLPANCVLFHMSDGIYTSFTDLPPIEHPIALLESGQARNTSVGEQFTASFDALMRLANLDECIQDALTTREEIESQMNAILKEKHTDVEAQRDVARAEDTLHQMVRTATAQRRQLRNEQKAKDDMRKSLDARRSAMSVAREEQERTIPRLSQLEDAIHATTSHLTKISERSAGQIRRVCEDLQTILPIESIPNRPLQFSIRGLPLPNSKFDDIDDRDIVAAALGFTCHLVSLLSQYLSVPLPYPIQHLASTSLIEDPISVGLPQRIYPLYPINVSYRFEYAVFLLNKDIEFLMNRYNLRMLDIRHTLPNLKYLVYVLTAGSGEIPARKAGGVKGLITGRMSPSLSRQSSEGSVSNGAAKLQPDRSIDVDFGQTYLDQKPDQYWLAEDKQLVPSAAYRSFGFSDTYGSERIDGHSARQTSEVEEPIANQGNFMDHIKAASTFRSEGLYMAAAMAEDQQPYMPDDGYAATTRTSASPPPVAHRRGYQACDACRKRKVKCDLGSVDNPEDPPCARCKRERRPCNFSETRRKRRLDQDNSEGPETSKRRLTADDSDMTPSRASGTSPQGYSWSPTPNANHTQYSTLPTSETHIGHLRTEDSSPYRQMAGQNGTSRLSAQQHSVPNQSVASLLHPNISTSHEALHLLSVAAGQSEEATRQNSKNQNENTPSSANVLPSPVSRLTENGSRAGFNRISSESQTDGIAGNASDGHFQDALGVWSRMKFVHSGLISAHEAIDYINYFYDHLAPLTPVALPDYRDPSTHLQLLVDEPILAVTMLSIASRHMKLQGAGSASRDFFVHDRIYASLANMLQKLMWAQEQFGGGFTGGGKVKIYEQKSGRITWKGSYRTLGTIEALMLLSEWHPRGLHFPPSDDDNRLLDMDYSILDEKDGTTSRAPSARASSTRESHYSAYIEPAWRCDRMSWTMLGLARSLAMELGLFDQFEKCTDGTESVIDEQCVRRRRVRLLLSTYIITHSGRMGIPADLPASLWEDAALTDPLATAKRRGRCNIIDAMQASWSDLVQLIHQLNNDIFLWKQRRQEIISSGKYVKVIEEVIPKMDSWMAKFDKVMVEEPLRTVILLEAYSVYLHVNGLALQASVEEVTNFQPREAQSTYEASGANNSTAPSATGLNPQVEALLRVQLRHGKYIRATADAARNILRLCLERLVPDNRLKHTPARALFRVTSGLLFSMKCFTFGAAESDMRETTELVKKCVFAMRAQAVDDVHIISQIANFADTLVRNIGLTMVCVSFPGTLSGATSRDRTPAHSMEQTSSNLSMERISQQSQVYHNTAGQYGYNLDNNAAVDLTASHPLQAAMDMGSLMPPEQYNRFLNGLECSPMQDQNMNGNLMADGDPWFALGLDPLMNSSDKDVSNGYGGLGPVVGERELLDVLTIDQSSTSWPAHMQFHDGNF